ncbi:MAG: hypothetical protein LBD97_01925 [Bifidobacteriaceae bacterium]|nr:hypothetical protein [Bifidobacteriaceae bacterium]
MAAEKKPGGGISVVQVLASALAAVTSTVALSYLGVAGTIMGAALASMITVVGNYIYSRSLTRTHRAVKTLAQQAATLVAVGGTARPGLEPTAGEGAEAAQEPVADAVDAAVEVEVPLGAANPADAAAQSEEAAEAVAVGIVDEAETLDDQDATSTESPAEPDARDPAWFGQMLSRYGTAQTLVALGISVFLLIIGIVTAVELMLGKPLSDELTGVDSNRNTTFINRPARQPEPTPSDGEQSEAPPSGDTTPADEPTAPDEPTGEPEPTPSESESELPTEPTTEPSGEETGEAPSDTPGEVPGEVPGEDPGEGLIDEEDLADPPVAGEGPA